MVLKIQLETATGGFRTLVDEQTPIFPDLLPCMSLKPFLESPFWTVRVIYRASNFTTSKPRYRGKRGGYIHPYKRRSCTDVTVFRKIYALLTFFSQTTNLFVHHRSFPSSFWLVFTFRPPSHHYFRF